MPELDLSHVSCPNRCPRHGEKGPNIRVRARYGKNREGILLYCRVCGKKFAAPRTKPFTRFRQDRAVVAGIVLRYGDEQEPSIRQIGDELELDKDTVNRALAEAERFSMERLRSLLDELQIPQAEFDRFWKFIRRRHELSTRKSRKSSDESD